MKKNLETSLNKLIDNQMASCHIVNEARAVSVRPLITSRPFTPLQTHRRLFGSTQKLNRPPSAITLGQVSYEGPADPPLQPRRLPGLPIAQRRDSLEEVFDEKIKPLLDKINEQKSEDVDEQQIAVISELTEKVTKLSGWQKGPQRSLILKSIFRLLSSKKPIVLLQVAKLLITLEIGKRNRTPLSKVIFHLTKDENNDQHFLQQHFSDSLLRFIEMMEVNEEWEALTYALGSLKLLSTNQVLLQSISKAGAVTSMANILETILKHVSLVEEEGMEHFLFQLTGSLRNMADLSSNRHQFVSSMAVIHLTSLLPLYSHDVDIILNIARILSKLTMYYEICNCLTDTNDDSLRAICNVLSSLPKEDEITVRLCFALGNIAAKNDKARNILFNKCQILPVLLQLMEEEGALGTGVGSGRRHQSEVLSFSKTENATELSLKKEIEIKAMCVLANLSINPKVGAQLASDSLLVQRLINRIAFQEESEPDEISITALSTLSNLSYYFSAQNQLFSTTNLNTSIKFIAAQLNSSTNQQVLSECLRLSSNISRGEGPRKLLSLSKVGTMTLKLMSEETLNKDLLFLCCGLMVNLTAEKNARINIRQENGVDSFTQVLSKSADENDWQLAGIVCQLLWNYLAFSAPSPHIDSNLKMILNLLQQHLNVSSPSFTNHDLWKLEFCPVATRLRMRINENERN